MMKKITKTIVTLLFMFMLTLALPVNVFAANEAVNVTDASADAKSFTVSGSTKASSVAVQLRQGKTIVGMGTLAVKGGKFSGTVKNLKLTNGTYTVFVADYEGGKWAKKEVVIGGSDDEIKPVDVEKTSAYIEKLYKNVMGRNSDVAGKSDWLGQMTNRVLSGAGLVNGFLNSPEYSMKSATDEEYVNSLYCAFFDRKPAAEEVSYWVDKIKSGTSRDEVKAGFANSKEFGNLCESMNISRGTMNSDGSVVYNQGAYLYVMRNYKFILGRDGEIDGAEYWAYKLNTKEMTPEEVINGFLNSEEFTNKKVSDEDFVEILYKVCLDRSSDKDGKAYWIKEIAARGDRMKIVSGFTDSAEFAEIKETFGM